MKTQQSAINVFTLVAVAATVLILNSSDVDALQCTKRSMTGMVETMNCPGLFEKSKKAYCCGTEMNRYCCKLSKAQEHGMRGGSSVSGGGIVKGIMTTILVILLIVGGCIALCCFCVCKMLRKKRTNQGHIVGGENTGIIGGQAVHVVPQHQAQPAGYPSQPAGYPSQPAGYPSYPTQQPAPAQAYPAYPNLAQAGYQAQAAPYPSYPMANVGGSDVPPPYPAEHKQPAYNPGYPQ